MLADVGRLKTLLSVRQRWQMLALFVGLVFAAALEMVGLGSIPAFVGLLTDTDRVLAILPEGAVATALTEIEPASLALYGAVALAALFLLKNLYLAALIYAVQSVVRNATVSVSTRLFRAYLFSPFTFHLQRNPAHLIRNITTDANNALQLIETGMNMLRESLVLIVVFILLLFMDPLISVTVFLLLGSASLTFYLFIRQRLSRRGRLAQGHRAAQIKLVNQGLGAIKDAKILGREAHVLANFELEARGIHRHQLYQNVMGQFPRLFLEVLAISAVLVVTIVFLFLGRPMQDMLPVLALLAVGVVRMVPAFNTITGALGTMRFQRPSLELVCEELDNLEPEITKKASTVGDGQMPVRPLRRAVQLQKVDYAYPNTSDPALKHVDITIGVGEAVALIGTSGAGKSTAVDVILGLLEPTRGRVMIDDWDLREASGAWQRQIGYIPQDIYLLDDSIRRNIAFGLADHEIDEEAVQAALRAAHLTAFIQSLPEGLDTVIGNRGIRLSGGQRQRIGIARALYHNPKVLIMDEATSALDNETEREVIDAINRLRGDRTIIMIAHRLTTVRGCDRLYLMDGGRVVDSGSPDELSARHPRLSLAATRPSVVGQN